MTEAKREEINKIRQARILPVAVYQESINTVTVAQPDLAPQTEIEWV